MRTSGEKFISSLHCVAKKEKSKRVPELGGRELTDLSPDVLTAYIQGCALLPRMSLLPILPINMNITKILKYLNLELALNLFHLHKK